MKREREPVDINSGRVFEVVKKNTEQSSSMHLKISDFHPPAPIVKIEPLDTKKLQRESEKISVFLSFVTGKSAHEFLINGLDDKYYQEFLKLGLNLRPIDIANLIKFQIRKGVGTLHAFEIDREEILYSHTGNFASGSIDLIRHFYSKYSLPKEPYFGHVYDLNSDRHDPYINTFLALGLCTGAFKTHNGSIDTINQLEQFSKQYGVNVDYEGLLMGLGILVSESSTILHRKWNLVADNEIVNLQEEAASWMLAASLKLQSQNHRLVTIYANKFLENMPPDISFLVPLLDIHYEFLRQLLVNNYLPDQVRPVDIQHLKTNLYGFAEELLLKSSNSKLGLVLPNINELVMLAKSGKIKIPLEAQIINNYILFLEDFNNLEKSLLLLLANNKVPQNMTSYIPSAAEIRQSIIDRGGKIPRNIYFKIRSFDERLY